MEWEKIAEGQLYTATKDGDKLQDLAKKITGDPNDWMCIWPLVQKDIKKEWPNYPTACRGAVAIVSSISPNSVRTSGIFSRKVYISLVHRSVYVAGAYYQDRPDAQYAATGDDVYKILKEKSGEGEMPIAYFEFFSHGNRNESVLRAQKKGMRGSSVENGFDPTNWNPNDPEPTLERASQQKGPHRCWFARQAAGFSISCEGEKIGEGFASHWLRKGSWIKTSRVGVRIASNIRKKDRYAFSPQKDFDDWGWKMDKRIYFDTLSDFLSTAKGWITHDGKL